MSTVITLGYTIGVPDGRLVLLIDARLVLPWDTRLVYGLPLERGRAGGMGTIQYFILETLFAKRKEWHKD